MVPWKDSRKGIPETRRAMQYGAAMGPSAVSDLPGRLFRFAESKSGKRGIFTGIHHWELQRPRRSARRDGGIVGPSAVKAW